jgi:hypothetical protein
VTTTTTTTTTTATTTTATTTTAARMTPRHRVEVDMRARLEAKLASRAQGLAIAARARAVVDDVVAPVTDLAAAST